MQLLYPEIKPYARHEIRVDEIHTLYVEECGDPSGVPVLFVHGGPGAGFSGRDRRFFDPTKFHIVLFDQRGCGRSKPHAELANNTTADLIADIEKIREHLAIDKWLLAGGSWGSTLSLLYAQSFPEKVTGLILRGIFMGSDGELDWLYRHGAHLIFPDYWQDFIKTIPEDERDDLIAAYHRRLSGDNELAKMAAAKAWATWEGRCATLRPSPNVVDEFSEPHMAVSLACIETHYFINKVFIEPNQILEQASTLAGIPGIIIHGRYDMVCTLNNAFQLHRAWPDAELHIIRDAGHSSHEPSIVDALIKASNAMALLLGDERDRSG